MPSADRRRAAYPQRQRPAGADQGRRCRWRGDIVPDGQRQFGKQAGHFQLCHGRLWRRYLQFRRVRRKRPCHVERDRRAVGVCAQCRLWWPHPSWKQRRQRVRHCVGNVIQRRVWVSADVRVSGGHSSLNYSVSASTGGQGGAATGAAAARSRQRRRAATPLPGRVERVAPAVGSLAQATPAERVGSRRV